jgi:hypothetical protein
MFHFPRFPPYTYVFSVKWPGIPLAGFPHSDIFGSKVACHLPKAFRRLLRPSSARFVKPFTIYPYCSPLTVDVQRPCWQTLRRQQVACLFFSFVNLFCRTSLYILRRTTLALTTVLQNRFF